MINSMFCTDITSWQTLKNENIIRKKTDEI